MSNLAQVRNLACSMLQLVTMSRRPVQPSKTTTTTPGELTAPNLPEAMMGERENLRRGQNPRLPPESRQDKTREATRKTTKTDSSGRDGDLSWRPGMETDKRETEMAKAAEERRRRRRAAEGDQASFA